MSNLIYGKLCEVGFCPDDAIEVIKALKTIVCIHGRSWRDELCGQYWFRATYPCLTKRQGELMQTLRNHPKGFSLIREISWMKIKAESLPKYTHYLSCREQTSRASEEEFRKFVRGYSSSGTSGTQLPPTAVLTFLSKKTRTHLPRLSTTTAFSGFFDPT